MLLLFLTVDLKHSFDFKAFKKKVNPKFKIHSIRKVGDKNSKVKDNIFVKQKKLSPGKKQKVDLTAKQLAPIFTKKVLSTSKSESLKKPGMKNLARPKAIRALSLNKHNIKSFLRGTPNAINSAQYMQALQGSESIVKLEVPKGVKETELNKHELVFYSFQKRTAVNYINSFYKKLNEFELKNPHLKFPLTSKKQKMVGRVVYDKDGNIVKINILKWTNVNKLQDFFVEVLKEMSSLPNPPDQIIEDDTFTVFYALTING